MSNSSNIIIILLILSISIQNSYEVTGWASSDFLTESQMTCLQQQGIGFIIQTADNGRYLNNYTLPNLINAKAVGLDVYLMLVSMGDYDPQEFAKYIKDQISQDMFTGAWYNPYLLSDESAQNCIYTQQVTSALIQAYSQSTIGMYSYYQMWSQKFGAPNNCSYFTNMTIGYGEIDYYPNFNDWKQIGFGGWKQPFAKIYGYDTICGTYNQVAWIN